MAENTTPPFNQAWLDTQKQFWEAWGNMSRAAMNNNPGAMPGWSDGLDLWWKTVAPATPEQSRQMFERFVEQGKQFFQFNENFLNTFKTMGPQAGGDWQKFWDQTLENLRRHMTGSMPFGQADLQGMWNQPLQQWQRMASMFGAFPGAEGFKFPSGGFPEMPGADSLHQHMNKLLATPGVGYTREWQEQAQVLARLWMEYQQAYRDYAEIFNRVAYNTVQRLQAKLMSLTGSENPVSTLREVYDMWVDCAEDAYAEMVNTEEYADVNARMVNALMAWKQQGRRMLDETLGMMNLPTRRELDSVHKRLHELRKQSRQGGGGDSTALQAEVSSLREEVNALREELAALKDVTPAPRRTTRKTPTAKGE